MNINSLTLLLWTLFLTACAEQATRPGVLVPVEERNAPVTNSTTGTITTAPVTNTAINDVNKPQQSVIVALLDDADKFASQGNSDKAAATIERALRIEPGNALLWHRLAVIRIQQQEWQQAIAMARKSNALAANNPRLKSDNWGVIALAYEKLGNQQKANEARSKQKAES
jgi:tetratricopeptide (TPR) repeat protein